MIDKTSLIFEKMTFGEQSIKIHIIVIISIKNTLQKIPLHCPENI